MKISVTEVHDFIFSACWFIMKGCTSVQYHLHYIYVLVLVDHICQSLCFIKLLLHHHLNLADEYITKGYVFRSG